MHPSRHVPTIERLDLRVVEILRGKTPEERLEMAFAANRFVREQLRSHLTFEHRDWSASQVQAEVARRMLWNNPKS